MKLEVLFNTLVVYHQNFRNLHWNACGESFDDAHKEIAKDYYEMTDATIDTVAEMLQRLDVNPKNISEIMHEVTTSEEYHILVVDSAKHYNRLDIVKLSQVMLDDICSKIVDAHESEELQTPINVGIKSTLETILEEYDMQARYLNKRKLENPENDVVARNDSDTETEPKEVPDDNDEDIVSAETPIDDIID